MVKRLIHRIFELCGYRLSKAPILIGGEKVAFNFLKQQKWLVEFGFRQILDIGANKGQFAAKARGLFPEAMIYSFEPIPEVFDCLAARFKDDSKFRAFNFGLGSENAQLDFFQNDFSDSSSILKMNDVHRTNFPKTQGEKEISVSVRTLDGIANEIQIQGPLLIKIDVQGYEEQVILGGELTIGKAAVVIVEVSFVELYEGQVLFDQIYYRLKRLGFQYMGNYEQLLSPLSGQVLQADAIFYRKR